MNGSSMRVSPLFRDVLGVMSEKNNISMFSLTHVIALNLKNRETNIIIPSRGKSQKIVIKQNNEKNFIDLF